MGLTRALGRLFRLSSWLPRHRRLPTRPVAQLKAGAVAKIEGRARCLGEPLLAPLSGRPCVLYRVTIECYDESRAIRFGGGGPSAPRWVHEAEEEQAPPFLVEDETGVALVRPEGWVNIIAPPRLFAADGLRAAEAHMDAFRARYGNERAAFLRGVHDRVRYRESVVCEGEVVFIAGLVGVERGGEGAEAGGYRGPTSRFVLRAPDDDRLVVGAQRPRVVT
jgi:hypothetical protein